MYSIPEILREARRQRGWGQRRLAEMAGVPQPNLAAYETGQRIPSLAMVRRLVGACGLQLRFDLEPRWAEVDEAVAHVLHLDPALRLERFGLLATFSAAALVKAGAPLILDGRLAARLLGAPVSDRNDLAWCSMTEVEALLAAARRCRTDVRPVHPRYAEDHGDGRPGLVFHDGDEVLIGQCRVRLGTAPAARWGHRVGDAMLPLVGVETLTVGRDWSGADRLAVRRLTAVLAERGAGTHGLDRYGR